MRTSRIICDVFCDMCDVNRVRFVRFVRFSFLAATALFSFF